MVSFIMAMAKPVKPSIVLFQHDLRIEDNPALTAAAKRGGPIIPLYVLAPEEAGNWAPGAASRWWLHFALERLQKQLAKHNLKLIIRSGNTIKEVKKIIQESQADAIFWNRHYGPTEIPVLTKLKKELQELTLDVQSFPGNLLFEPWTILTKEQHPYKVFTAFWKACQKELPLCPPLSGIAGKFPSAPFQSSLDLSSLSLLPQIPWDKGMREAWKLENGTHKLEAFLEGPILNYLKNRDRPDLDATSHLSPYLHFGEITPRMIWQSVCERYPTNNPSVETFLRQLGWREFAYYLLYHFPHTSDKPLRTEFERFPWEVNELWLKAWKQGKTGYPIVDAGMRQLWQTGWMHNRVRMIVGSFLVKDLLIPWQVGARWFWETLVDADLANNSMGWQWVSGSGADAAPYFRIFNPTTQGEKFDPNGEYIRRWVPELAKVPAKWIHQPWAAPMEVRQLMQDDYPMPIVDHQTARAKALQAFEKIKKKV